MNIIWQWYWLEENESTYSVANTTVGNLYIKINWDVSMEDRDIVVPNQCWTMFPKDWVKTLSFFKEDVYWDKLRAEMIDNARVTTYTK